jgi:hypothetical protein
MLAYEALRWRRFSAPPREQKNPFSEKPKRGRFIPTRSVKTLVASTETAISRPSFQ